MKQQYYFKSDKQNYIVRKNKDLIKYIRNTSKKGIEFEINLNEMQQLIDYVGFWYELKYSNEYLSKENINDKDTIYDIKKLYNSLFNMKSFLQNERISNFLSCNYRGRYDYIGIDNREYIYLESRKKDDNESIFIDKINGNVYNNKFINQPHLDSIPLFSHFPVVYSMNLFLLASFHAAYADSPPSSITYPIPSLI